MDILVTRGSGERDHTPSNLNNQIPNEVDLCHGNNQIAEERKQSKLAPPTGLMLFNDDGSQELSLGPDTIQTTNPGGDFLLEASLHEIVMRDEAAKIDREPMTFTMHRYNGGMANGETAVGGGGTGKRSLEFMPAGLDLISEDAPANHLESKWYQDSDDPYLDSIPPSLAQETGKVEDTQSSMSDTNFLNNSSQPIEGRSRTRSQSSLQKASSSTCSSETHILSGRGGLTSSMSALDHLSLDKRSHSTDLGNIRIKKRGRNSLEALTKIGSDQQPLSSGSTSAIKRHRSDENTHRIKPLHQRSARSENKVSDQQPSLKQTHNTPHATSKQSHEGSDSVSQLSGSDYHGSAPRLTHSTSIEGKGRRARSYQSQRAKLHSSRSAAKMSGSQELSESLERPRHSRSRRSMDRSDTSLEGSASQDKSIQSDETLVESRSVSSVQPAEPVVPVVRINKQPSPPEAQQQRDVIPSKLSSIGRQHSLKEGHQNSSIVRRDKEREKRNRPVSAVETQFRHAAFPLDDRAHSQLPPPPNKYAQAHKSNIPLYKTRSAQTPFGQQVFREVNIEEAIARSQMTQEGMECEGRGTTFEPVRREEDHRGNNSKRKDFEKKSMVSVHG